MKKDEEIEGMEAGFGWADVGWPAVQSGGGERGWMLWQNGV